MLKQEIDGLGATNEAKQLAKRAAEKNAMVNKLVATVRHKALQSKRERLESSNEKLSKATDTLKRRKRKSMNRRLKWRPMKEEIQDMAKEIETLVKEMEKLNKLRVDEIQKTYDSYIGYLNTEKKAREQEVKEAQVALDKEMNALEQTRRGSWNKRWRIRRSTRLWITGRTFRTRRKRQKTLRKRETTWTNKYNKIYYVCARARAFIYMHVLREKKREREYYLKTARPES